MTYYGKSKQILSYSDKLNIWIFNKWNKHFVQWILDTLFNEHWILCILNWKLRPCCCGLNSITYVPRWTNKRSETAVSDNNKILDPWHSPTVHSALARATESPLYILCDIWRENLLDVDFIFWKKVTMCTSNVQKCWHKCNDSHYHEQDPPRLVHLYTCILISPQSCQNVCLLYVENFKYTDLSLVLRVITGLEWKIQ